MEEDEKDLTVGELIERLKNVDPNFVVILQVGTAWGTLKAVDAGDEPDECSLIA